MLVEDVATGERQRVAADFPVRVGQEIVVQGRRWRVAELDEPDGLQTAAGNVAGMTKQGRIDHLVRTMKLRQDRLLWTVADIAEDLGVDETVARDDLEAAVRQGVLPPPMSAWWGDDYDSAVKYYRLDAVSLK